MNNIEALVYKTMRGNRIAYSEIQKMAEGGVKCQYCGEDETDVLRTTLFGRDVYIRCDGWGCGSKYLWIVTAEREGHYCRGHMHMAGKALYRIAKEDINWVEKSYPDEAIPLEEERCAVAAFLAPDGHLGLKLLDCDPTHCAYHMCNDGKCTGALWDRAYEIYKHRGAK